MEMMRINSESMVDMIFHLKWKSEFAMHTDGYQASRINMWRDYFPPDLLGKIMDRQAGERIEVNLNSDDILPPFDDQNLVQVKRVQFEQALASRSIAMAGVGRFYPKGML
jgi:hypothetical protein